MEKFQNKYRIDSARLKGYDYTQNGAYFITICTQNREHHFGEIQNGKMILSPCGVLADVFWHEIKNHTTGVELGAFVVMPNHIHGILILNRVVVVETRHASSNNNNNHLNPIKTKKWPQYPHGQVQYQPLSVPTNRLLPNTPTV